MNCRFTPIELRNCNSMRPLVGIDAHLCPGEGRSES